MAVTIYLDFETTGLNIFHDDIIEYALLDAATGDSETSLVKLQSKRNVSKFISTLTGITDKMLISEGISVQEAVHRIKDFIIKHSRIGEDVVLIAHNGDSFDFPIFRRLLKEHIGKINRNIKYFDTLRFAQVLLPRLHKFSQANLCLLFKIKNEKAHRAISDVVTLDKIYRRLTSIYSCTKTNIYDHIKLVYEKI